MDFDTAIVKVRNSDQESRKQRYNQTNLRRQYELGGGQTIRVLYYCMAVVLLQGHSCTVWPQVALKCLPLIILIRMGCWYRRRELLL